MISEINSQLLYNLVIKKLKLLKNTFLSKLSHASCMRNALFGFFNHCAINEEALFSTHVISLQHAKAIGVHKNDDMCLLISVSNNLVGNLSLLFYTALSTYMCSLYNPIPKGCCISIILVSQNEISTW